MRPWERIKIGAGTPPVLTRLGWLMLYHGVCDTNTVPGGFRSFQYSAGVMILDSELPYRILYRSLEPELSPKGDKESFGKVDNVVFPTGIDPRDDLGRPDTFDIYYGMADSAIGVVRLELPNSIPTKNNAMHS